MHACRCNRWVTASGHVSATPPSAIYDQQHHVLSACALKNLHPLCTLYKREPQQHHFAPLLDVSVMDVLEYTASPEIRSSFFLRDAATIWLCLVFCWSVGAGFG